MRRSLLLVLFMGSVFMAHAQMGEIGLSFGASKLRDNDLGSLPQTQGYKAESNFRFAIRFTINNYRFFGHEFGYAYTRGKLTIPASAGGGEVGMPIHQGMYNFLVYATPEGGGHFSTFYPPGSSVFQGNGVTKFGFNYGGGVKARISETWLVRFDVRDYSTGKPDFGLVPEGRLKQLEVSGRLRLRLLIGFGCVGQASACPDAHKKAHSTTAPTVGSLP
jgi:opacity protein-like surface antigen